MLEVPRYLMKRLFLLPLLLMLASCSSKPILKNYSFNITDKVTSFNLKSDGDIKDNYCYRRGTVQWELDIEPSDFSGQVVYRGNYLINGKEMGEAWKSSFDVINGEMLPEGFDFYGSPDKEYFRRLICSFEKADQLGVNIDRSTLVMIPGAHPIIPEEPKGE